MKLVIQDGRMTATIAGDDDVDLVRDANVRLYMRVATELAKAFGIRVVEIVIENSSATCAAPSDDASDEL